MPTLSPGSSSFFPSRRHIAKREDPGDEVVGYVDQDAYRVDFPEKLTLLKKYQSKSTCSSRQTWQCGARVGQTMTAWQGK